MSSELSRNAHLDDAAAVEAEEVAAGVAATVYLGSWITLAARNGGPAKSDAYLTPSRRRDRR